MQDAGIDIAFPKGFYNFDCLISSKFIYLYFVFNESIQILELQKQFHSFLISNEMSIPYKLGMGSPYLYFTPDSVLILRFDGCSDAYKQIPHNKMLQSIESANDKQMVAATREVAYEAEKASRNRSIDAAETAIKAQNSK